MAKKIRKWSRLDNAAKIFPSTSKKTDTCVFRFYCELKEKVVPERLQTALNSAIKEFPDFRCAMRKGAFWYYLEETAAFPTVTNENTAVCSQIYDGDNSALLFNVSYCHNRINLEIFHALADGTGALGFLKTIVYYYLKDIHSDNLPPQIVFMENDSSYTQKNDDSFSKYYRKMNRKQDKPPRRVYNLYSKTGDAENVGVTEAIVSVKEVIAAAHAHNTTLTVFLTAVFFDAIQKEMSLEDKKKPVVIIVPVNLRQYFPSSTMRNFFGLIDISYDFSVNSGDFEDIIKKVSDDFKEKLTKDKLEIRMNKLAGIERNFFAKIAPLPLKDVALRGARRLDEKNRTAVISNVGKVTMPTELADMIDFFGVLASTLTLQLCVCSYMDKLQIGFTSTLVSVDIQKNFIRTLADNGITGTIRSNDFYISGDEN